MQCGDARTLRCRVSGIPVLPFFCGALWNTEHSGKRAVISVLNQVVPYTRIQYWQVIANAKVRNVLRKIFYLIIFLNRLGKSAIVHFWKQKLFPLFV